MFNKSIQQAKKLLKTSDDKAHDIAHTRRVVQNTKILCKILKYKRKKLLILCAWWHDVGRLYKDEGHEQLSAEMAKKDLISRGANENTTRIVYETIRVHKWNMNPQTIEGKIIRDADKLDFISPARWRTCLKLKQPKHLISIKKILPNLYSYFSFDATRKIYQKRLKRFLSTGLINKI